MTEAERPDSLDARQDTVMAFAGPLASSSSVTIEGKLPPHSKVETRSGKLTDAEQLLLTVAERNELSDDQWPMLRQTMQHKIAEHIPSLRTSDETTFDKAATPPWVMNEEDVKKMTDRLTDLLGNFDKEAPFTVQRLAELAISPAPHYTSLPKYLRALERCLMVSSPLAAFPPAPTPALEDNGGFHANGRPARSRSSSVTTPLLSPIPFLVRPQLPGSPGRVDELDLGDGTATMADDGPMALSSTTTGDNVQDAPPTVETTSLANGDAMEVDKAVEGKTDVMDVVP